MKKKYEYQYNKEERHEKWLKYREHYKERYKNFVNSGLCPDCGKEPSLDITIYCSQCREKRLNRQNEWRNKNRERCKRAAREFAAKYKKIVFDHYGYECKCCKENITHFLTIDHINNDGAQHRKLRGSNLYKEIIKEGLPNSYQTLCFNCNVGKYRNKGTCPHEEKRKKEEQIN